MMYRSFAYQAVVAEKAYQELDPQNTGFITAEELQSQFTCLLHSELMSRFPGKDESWYNAKLVQFCDLMIDTFAQDSMEDLQQSDTSSPSQKKNKKKEQGVKGISHQEFIRNCTSSAAST
eukprot:gnl/TRDRNA2_/TRDRNA2_160375_c1_seq5.p1 gnl/TRDRNA2_/TRDRNA2_160375_c1~~gnl/TRDRNA2_/TRDRNA2_160375_c1_seq5.p1  ORF type:complete len:120 (-),score=27.48 gnl/TRDRNA2_/TRDRNA2_160375_c1_seq5:28-387(-)